MAFTGKHTEEAKKKISEASKRLWQNPNHRKRMQNKLRGKKRSKSARDAYVAAQVRDYSFLDSVSDVEWAYFAGILDGEGSIYLVKRVDRPTFALMVSVSNTNFDVIEWIYQKLGGYWRGDDKSYKGWKKKWIWITAHTHAGEIIRRARPYMIVKAPQADLALEFLKHKTDPLEKQKEFRDRISKLNQKGVDVDNVNEVG